MSPFAPSRPLAMVSRLAAKVFDLYKFQSEDTDHAARSGIGRVLHGLATLLNELQS